MRQPEDPPRPSAQDRSDAPLRGARHESAPQPAPAGVAERLRVAFQGEPGAFSEDAIYALWGPLAEPVPMATFAAVMDAAEEGDVDFGLLPVESTLVGDVSSAYDLLALHDCLLIAAEVVLPVRLAVLGLPGASIARLRSIASHPLILEHCVYFLERHRGIAAEPTADTAGAAREVAENGDPSRAAVGSRRAAEQYGLEILADGVEDRPDSQFRFLAVGRDPSSLSKTATARTAVCCVFPDAAGSLVKGLQPIADASFRITHLAARPTREPWSYRFFLEFEHPALDQRAAEALDQLKHVSLEYRLLGTYPKWLGTDESPTIAP
ncbi:MAG TPA: prephenate dehydratase domain-containing protein [Gemmatimonadaceae bacterium]